MPSETVKVIGRPTWRTPAESAAAAQSAPPAAALSAEKVGVMRFSGAAKVVTSAQPSSMRVDVIVPIASAPGAVTENEPSAPVADWAKVMSVIEIVSTAPVTLALRVITVVPAPPVHVATIAPVKVQPLAVRPVWVRVIVSLLDHAATDGSVSTMVLGSFVASVWLFHTLPDTLPATVATTAPASAVRGAERSETPIVATTATAISGAANFFKIDKPSPPGLFRLSTIRECFALQPPSYWRRVRDRRRRTDAAARARRHQLWAVASPRTSSFVPYVMSRTSVHGSGASSKTTPSYARKPERPGSPQG